MLWEDSRRHMVTKTTENFSLKLQTKTCIDASITFMYCPILHGSLSVLCLSKAQVKLTCDPICMTASWRKQHSCLTRSSIPCMKLFVGHKYSWQSLQWGKAVLLNHLLKPTFIDSPTRKVLISLYHYVLSVKTLCECFFERCYTDKIIQSFQVIIAWRLAIINYSRKNETAPGYLWPLSAFTCFSSQLIHQFMSVGRL